MTFLGGDERCELSDLPGYSCDHCRTGARNLGPDRLDLLEDDEVDET